MATFRKSSRKSASRKGRGGKRKSKATSRNIKKSRTSSGKRKNKGKLSFLKRRRKNKKSKSQKGGFKSCSLGYAMVQGMDVPAINNVEGDIQFNDVYARLNSGNCNVANNNGGVNHPVLKTN